MLNRISVRLAASLTTFVALMIAAFLSSYVFVEKQATGIVYVKLAETEQRAAEKIAKDAIAVGLGAPGAYGAEDVRAQLRAFEDTLNVLGDGGSSPILPGVTVPAVPAGVSDLVVQARNEWSGFEASVEKLLTTRAPEDTKPVLDGTLRLGASLEALTARVEADAAANVATVMTLQGLALLAVVLLWGLMLYFTWRDIGVPLQRLVQASEKMSTGDVETTIQFAGLAEVEELAQSFERLRLSVRTLLSQAKPAGLGELDDL